MKILVIFLVAIIFAAGCVNTGNVANPNGSGTTGTPSVPSQPTAQLPSSDQGAQAQPPAGAVKEFYMDSYSDRSGERPKPRFSLSEMTVNKGDTVIIYVNTTSGTHDFKIDELNVQSDTPTGKVTKIEFVASQAGDFVYFCNMPGHRANGQWGTLHVIG